MMTIEDFGARVASVWQGLRPSTRSLVERALSTPPPASVAAPRGDTAYDARSEWELSRLLAALLERALRARDYARVDALADVMTARLAPSEVCEMARCANPAVRAVAQETLLQLPTAVLVALLGDPVDAEVARAALESQADEYESEEARFVVNALEQVDADEDDF